METKFVISKLGGYLSKYKFVIIVLAVGLIFMLLPSGLSSSKNEKALSEPTVPVNTSSKEELETILSQIRGAGRVQVMLTVEEGEKVLYQTDTEMSSSENDSSHRIKTITITDSQRNETGMITQVNPPKYLGAIIVCQGADDPNVKLSIIDAVTKITGLGSDKISVIKMK